MLNLQGLKRGWSKKAIVTQKKFYTYTLAYPMEMGGHVFYVGKGTGDRLLIHEEEAKRDWRGRKYEVIREILANGYQVQRQIVYETDNELEALIYEWAGINMIWPSPYLTNTIANPYSAELNKAEKERRRRILFQSLKKRSDKQTP